MRAFLLALALLAAGLVPPPAQAAAEPFIKDNEGDTQFSAAYEGSPANAPFTGGDSAAADILALDVIETDTTLDFQLALKSLKLTAGSASYEIFFTFNKVEYYIWVRQIQVPPNGPAWSAWLAVRDEYWYDTRAELDPVIDLEKGTIFLSVEKVYILDADEETPERGDTLKNVHALAHLELPYLRSGFFGEVVDRAPDGNDAKTLRIQYGDTSVGSLFAEAESRVRVSNGGSTTFVYRILLTNQADRGDEVDVALENLPQDWNATVKSPVRLDGQGTKQITVLASVPFGHTHGGFDSFNVTMRSRNDPGSYASVRLGVLHTPIPQPAGHHSDLFLHVEQRGGFRIGSGSTEPSMSTESSRDSDHPEVFPTSSENGALIWWIPLKPRLAMGLDFDLERLGTLAGALNGRGTGEARVSAELIHAPMESEYWDLEDSVTLAESDTQTVTLSPNGATPFSLTLTPTEDADYVPYDPRMNMFLLVWLEDGLASNFCCLDRTEASLVTQDFKLSLPLNEYHDRLTGIAEAAALLDLVADGPVEKLGRPGTTMTYLFTLKNGGAQPVTVEVDVAGSDAAYGTMVPKSPIVLDAKETRKITLAVAIPPEAAEGQEIEVLLFAHDRDDPSRTAIARTKTVVTLKGEAVADETGVLLAAQEAENETPGPGVALALAAIAGAVLVGRRRRA